MIIYLLLPCLFFHLGPYLPKGQTYDNSHFNYEKSVESLKEQLKVSSLIKSPINNRMFAINASGALLDYIFETQKRKLIHINEIEYLSLVDYMQLDANTRKNLELTETMKDRKKRGSLFWALNKTKTSMGARLLKSYIEQPLYNEKAINNNVPKILWQKLQSGKDIIFNDITYSPDMVLGDDRKGIKISFITDTRPILSIPEFIKNSDLFICESMYGDDLDISKAVKNKHMTFREAANLARLGNVKNLVLTHFSPSLGEPNLYKKNATDVFENTIIGEDRLSFSLNFEN